MFRLNFFAFLTLSAFAFKAQASDIPDDSFWFLLDENTDKIVKYIDLYKHIAVSEMDRSGVPASIKMAQGILESGSGESELATKAKNHFGIKCGGDWTGETYYVWDDEPVKSCFRVYPTVEACYIAHTDFLTNPAKEYRYGPLFKLERTDYKGWANGLQKAGYATSQTYAVKLISLIERYELFKLDYLSSQTIAINDDEMERTFGYPAKPLYQAVDTQATTTTTVASVTIFDPFSEGGDVEVQSFTTDVFELYGLKTVFVQQGDTPLKLAERYKIPIKRLSKYNEWGSNRPLKVGHYIFLQKKLPKYKGEHSIHTAHSDETLYDISQRYGIQLKTLLKYNKRYSDKEPKQGEKVALRP